MKELYIFLEGEIARTEASINQLASLKQMWIAKGMEEPYEATAVITEGEMVSYLAFLKERIEKVTL